MLKSLHCDTTITLKTAPKWYERLKTDRELVEDEQWVGRSLMPKNRWKGAKSGTNDLFQQEIDYLRAFRKITHFVQVYTKHFIRRFANEKRGCLAKTPRRATPLLVCEFLTKKCSCLFTSGKLSGYRTTRLLALSKNKNRNQRKTLWYNSWYWKGDDSAIEGSK